LFRLIQTCIRVPAVGGTDKKARSGVLDAREDVMRSRQADLP